MPESISRSAIEALAAELNTAAECGLAVPTPSSRPEFTSSGFTLNDAYAVEEILKLGRESAGHKSVGRKVGYANKAMWRVLKLETLVWAHMYEDTVHHAANNSATLTLRNTRSLRIEPEIVFGVKQTFTSQPLDASAALAAADWLALGFEIIDCPYPDWKFQPADFVASFGLHAALIVGDKIPISADRIPQLLEELARFKLRMLKGRERQLVEEGSGKNSLKSPALCLAELGAAIARRFPNELLSAGEIVSSGTLTAGHLTAPGDLWTAEVEGISLPPLTLALA